MFVIAETINQQGEGLVFKVTKSDKIGNLYNDVNEWPQPRGLLLNLYLIFLLS